MKVRIERDVRTVAQLIEVLKLMPQDAEWSGWDDGSLTIISEDGINSFAEIEARAVYVSAGRVPPGLEVDK